MENKLILSIVVVAIVAVVFFSSSNLNPLQTSPDPVDSIDFIEEFKDYYNPIDLNNEFEDYEALDYGTWEEYVIIGRFAGIVGEDFLVQTRDRTVAIRKPADTTYLEFTYPTPTPILEREIVQNELVRAKVAVDKASNHITELKIIIIRIANEGGDVLPSPGVSS